MLKLTDRFGNVVSDGDCISLVSKEISEYMKLDNYDCETIEKYCNWKSNNYYPNAITIVSDGNSVSISENGKETVLNTEAGTTVVTNLFPGYKYTISSEKESVSFFTENIRPRTISIDSIDNTRDLGGEGIKYGILYRGATLAEISDAGLSTFTDELGIKTELSLSGGETCEKIENAVHVERHGIFWYNNIFNNDEEKNIQLKQTLEFLANEEVYPVYFHCALGRDRTGTLAFILGALCGRDYLQLKREHFLSFFSVRGDGENVGVGPHMANIEALYSLMMSVKGSEYSLYENTVAYLNSIGVDNKTIDKIKSIISGSSLVRVGKKIG